MDEISKEVGVDLQTESLLMRAEQLTRLESDKLIDKVCLHVKIFMNAKKSKQYSLFCLDKGPKNVSYKLTLGSYDTFFCKKTAYRLKAIHYKSD